MNNQYPRLDMTKNRSIQDQSILPSSNNIMPNDTISSLSWHPNTSSFGITSFDGTFRIYQINFGRNESSFLMSYVFQYKFPLLSFQFIPDNPVVFIGSCDGNILVVNYQTDQQNQVSTQFEILGKHECPVFKMFWIQEMGHLLTLDTFNSVKTWDLKELKLVNDVKLNRCILDCDFVFPLLVIALNGEYIKMIDIKNLNRLDQPHIILLLQHIYS